MSVAHVSIGLDRVIRSCRDLFHASPFRTSCALALLWQGMVTTPACAALVLNEITYDPEGSDAGREWVELHNSGSFPAPLEGVRLEAGNGSLPDQWTVAWEGRSSDWIEPGGWFVIGDSTVADAPTPLSLQNGPDAVRLSREGLILDVVGWGALAHPEYFEARPSPEAHGIETLARARDGADTDDNLADFIVAAASPGRANRAQIDLALQIVDPKRWLPLPAAPDTRVAVPIRLTNRGELSIALTEVTLWVAGNLEPGRIGTLDPSAERLESVWVSLPQGPGVCRIGAHGQLARDENPDQNSDSLFISVGTSPLWLAEVHARPLDGPEWIELVADRELDTSGWSFEDAGGARLFLPDTILARGSRLLLSAAPMERAASWSGSWPSLNDRAGERGMADSLFLFDSESVIRDWMVYEDAAPNRSWSRLEPSLFGLAAWSLDETPGGTPGAAGAETRTVQDPGARAVARGVSLERSEAGVWIRVSSETAPLDYRVRILDLLGRTIWRDRGRVMHLGEERCRWDGRDTEGRLVPQGVYFVETERDWSTGRDRSQLPLVVGR